jgi:hypothetical protein
MLFVPLIMQSKFHIRLALRRLVDNKHIIVTIIRKAILMDQIAQSDDVGDGSCLRVTTIVPPLIFSLMLVVDLQVLLTKAALQKRSIVD